MASTMSVSGIVSGMDWESMIDELITKAAKPAQVQVSKKTNLQNKKSLFEEMKVMVQSIQSSLSPLKLPSTYRAKELDIERIDTSGSYKGVLTASVNADAEVNVYDLKVNRLATAQTNRSAQITTSTIASALGSINSGTMYINMGGRKIGVDVSATDSLQTLKSKINTALKTSDTPMAVTASVVDSKLILKSDSTGLGTASNTETLSYGFNGVNRLTTMNVSDADLQAGNFVIRDSKSKQYTYGDDYFLVNGDEIRWRQYDESQHVGLGESVNVKYTLAAGDVYTVTASVGKDATLPFDVVDGGTLASRLKITDENGETYTYGTDFELSNGAIRWITSSYTPATYEPDKYMVNYSKTVSSGDIDVTTTAGMAKLTASYNEIYGLDEATALPTVTLTDGNGVLRTYIDPKDSSKFVLTQDTGTVDENGNAILTKYEYGKDYVIRVNDSGDGYVFSWTLTGDTNGDGSVNINDANKVVTAYMQAKGLDTYGIQQAPSGSFTFQVSSTTAATAEVSKGNTKSLSSLLGISDIDTSKIEIKTTNSDGKEEKVDSSHYTIDNGHINWARKDSIVTEEPEGYSLSYTASDGKKYTSADYTEAEILKYIDEDTGYADNDTKYSNLVIKASNGTEYIYGLDYDGVAYDGNGNLSIDWQYANYTDTTPESGTEYTLTYESFAGAESDEITEDGIVRIPASSGNITGGYLSYEQLVADSRGAFKNYLTLTDGTETYTYGTDYTITKGGGADDTSGGHSPVITWLNDDNKPNDMKSLTLTYAGGGEVYNTSLTRSATDTLYPNSTSDYPLYDDLSAGDTTITQGTKTFYEGIDYKIVRDEGDSTHAAVQWLSDSDGGYEWYMPSPGSSYTLNLTASDGTTKSYNSHRSSRDTLNMADMGFTTANGNISVKYGGNDSVIKYFDPEKTYTETTTDDDGNTTTTQETGNDRLRYLYSFTVARGTQGGVDTVFNFNWQAPTRTDNANMPETGDELTVEYEYDANTFSLSDDMDGELIAALGLLDDVTEAQDAELELDGEIVTRSSNYIGESYDNELIKGMTIQLKGVGEVSLDVSHNAQKAVESINTFMESYNSLMSWMNTRLTESQVDKDTAATVDSDDFRMRWGLLHGNSLLRNTKSQMRDLMAQSFNYSFTKRTSEEEIYGTMSNNGLRADSTLRLRIGSKYADITIYQTDTLQDIADRINDSSNTEMRSMFYGDDGELLDQPLIKASISDDKLVISSTSDDAITMSGTAAMNALKMNYTYKGLFQLGLATTSTDYGKSGELEFDESTFMEAMTDNPEEVQELMLMFAGEMDTWVKSMLTTSASGETSGTLTRQIEDLETQIESINDYLETYQDRLDRQEEALRTRYANAETQFYKLSQQANSIAAILNQLNGYSSSSSDS